MNNVCNKSDERGRNEVMNDVNEQPADVGDEVKDELEGRKEMNCQQ